MANPVEAQDYFNRGLDQLHAGDWKSALDDFTEAIKLRPDIAVGWRFRSYAFAEAGNVIRAIADLDEALRLKPDDVQAYYDRGQHFLRQKQYEQALEDCNKALAEDAGRADLLGLRGRVHAAKGTSEDALFDYSQAIQMDPEGAKDYYIWRGDLYMDLEDPQKAIEDYSASLLREPNSTHALSQRGHAFWIQGDLTSALADLNLAVEIDPNWHWLRVRRGALHNEMKEYDQALSDFNRAIEMNPKYILAYEYRSETNQNLGKKPESLADLSEALKLQPEGSQALRILNRRAMIHYFNKEYLRAIRDHTEALKKEPDHAATFNYLAWIWCTAPDPNVRNGRRALECATRANELTEFENPGFLDTLAAAHAELGQFQEAMEWEGKAIELAEDEDTREEYATRIDQYGERKPLRVTPKSEV